jgi:hypothetical protein
VVSTKYLVFFYEEILQFVFTQICCILSCTETVANRWIVQPRVRKWNINTISQIDCCEDMIIHSYTSYHSGAMLNSRHDQPLANTCVTAVAVVSSCRRTRVTNDGRRLGRVLSYLYIVYCIYWIIFECYMLHCFFAFTLFVRVVLITQFVSLSSRFYVNTGSIGFMLFLYILQ